LEADRELALEGEIGPPAFGMTETESRNRSRRGLWEKTMKKRAVILNGITTLALVAGMSAQAASSNGSSSVQVKKVLGLEVDKMILRYDGLFQGAKVTDPVSRIMPDPITGKDDPSGQININHNVSAGYQLSKSVALTAVLDCDSNAGTQTWKTFEMRDPWLRLAKTGLVKAGNYTLNADLRLFAPTSIRSGSRSDVSAAGDRSETVANRNFTIGTKTVSQLSIPGSRFSAVMYNRVYVYSQTAFGELNQGSGGRQFRLYMGPELDYQISPKVTAWLLYEADGYHHSVAMKDGSRWEAGTDLEPGISWDVTPNLNLSPFVDIKTGGTISLDTTQIGLSVGFKML